MIYVTLCNDMSMKGKGGGGGLGIGQHYNVCVCIHHLTINGIRLKDININLFVNCIVKTSV